MSVDQNTALIIVHPQKFFGEQSPARWGNAETETICDRLSRIADDFRRAGGRVYVLKADMPELPEEDSLFHKFTPDPTDKIVITPDESGFEDTALRHDLRAEGIDKILTCGFNFSVCLGKTALDGRRYGFDVSVITDLSANSGCCTDEMAKKEMTHDLKDRRVKFITSADMAR